MVMVGMIMAMVGAVSASFGLLLIKSGGKLEQDRPWYRRTTWLLGFVMQAGVSAVTDTIAYSTCPLSLISPFAGLTIAFSAVWAMLGVIKGIHERTSLAELATIALLFAGVTLSSVFGPREVGNGNLDRLGTYLTSPLWLVLWVAQSALILGWAIISAVPALRALFEPDCPTMCTVISATAAAACAALTQCFLKVPAMLIPHFFDRGSLPVANFWVWLSVVLLVVYAITQLNLLNVLMSRGRVMLAVPIFSSLNLLLTMTSSALLFGDFDAMDSTHTTGFLSGAAVVVAGIFVLPRLQGDDEESQADAEAKGGAAAREVALMQAKYSDSSYLGYFCSRFFLVKPWRTPPENWEVATASTLDKEA